MSAVADATRSDDPREAEHRAYFDWQLGPGNAEFFGRLDMPDVAGLRILDLGCGHGALAVELARRGAARVVGVDLDADRIDFARRHVGERFPEIAGRVAFQAADIATVDETFDMVISKDTLEHVLDVPAIAAEIRRLLVPGGLLMVGFAPLYWSPFGDHGRFTGRRRGVPWLPAILPEGILLALARRMRGEDVRSVADLGLNKLDPATFRRIFGPPLWRIERIEYNRGGRRLLRALSALRRIAALEKYATVSIYGRIRRN